MKPLPDAWLVVYQYNGVEAKYVTVDHSAADIFAVKQRGIGYPLNRGTPNEQHNTAA